MKTLELADSSALWCRTLKHMLRSSTPSAAANVESACVLKLSCVKNYMFVFSTKTRNS